MTLYDWAIILYDPALNAYKPQDYPLADIALSGAIACLVGGVFISTIEVQFFSKLFRKQPFGLSILAKSAFYMTNIFVFTSLAILLQNSLTLKESIFHRDVVQPYLDLLFSPRLLTLWFFWGVAVILALFVLQVSEKLGQGVLINFLLGKYHQPREETRVFMFIDLKSSTSYAERLGHIKYSELIQDCFYDMTDVVTRHRAQIYQYVGDEVVLTWKYKEGIKNENYIGTFFDYDRVIRNRSEYYEKKYGMIPEFKAGLDSGVVTAAEVGEIKKELAYHGDVLNTASRITEKCNEFKTKVLISEGLKNHFDKDCFNDLFELIGNVKLKGKENPVNIYKVKEPALLDSKLVQHG